jgi:hypothetical protein
MRPDYQKLLLEHNLSSMLLDQKGCLEAMEICYEEGLKDGEDKFLNFLEKMTYLSDNINYIIEEWKNQKK